MELIEDLHAKESRKKRQKKKNTLQKRRMKLKEDIYL